MASGQCDRTWMDGTEHINRSDKKIRRIKRSRKRQIWWPHVFISFSFWLMLWSLTVEESVNFIKCSSGLSLRSNFCQKQRVSAAALDWMNIWTDLCVRHMHLPVGPPHVGWFSGSGGSLWANQSVACCCGCLGAFSWTDGSLVNERWHSCGMGQTQIDWMGGCDGGGERKWDPVTGTCQCVWFFSLHTTTQTD